MVICVAFQTPSTAISDIFAILAFFERFELITEKKQNYKLISLTAVAGLIFKGSVGE
jgi:hypothetical protein